MFALFEYLSDLFSNPIFNGIGLILGLIFGVLGVILTVFTIVSKKMKKACYTIESFNFINEKSSTIDNIKISYMDKPIKNFTISKMRFWNNDEQAIRDSDIPKAEPIIINVKDGFEILDASMTAMTSDNNVNEFELEKISNRTIKLKFKYIDKDEGVNLRVAHTGKSNDDIEFKGKIIGWKLLNVDTNIKKSNRATSIALSLTLLVVALPVMSTFSYASNYIQTFFDYRDVTQRILGYGLSTIAFLGAAAIAVFISLIVISFVSDKLSWEGKIPKKIK